ncbi:cytoplasmic dynein 1 light intermediate chain 2-like isoform X1 [Convolutriloba macropyga]|uniref:cytoplasmic dynein 1 light intermediate chain 2-like isoform X1 n=1 Tax=Convolutriloba macropyga TaxID=536237 RepID=UPI003F51AFCF
MSKLLGNADPYSKSADDKKLKSGTGIWSELLDSVSSGLPNDLKGHQSSPDDTLNGDVSLTNGEVEGQGDGSTAGAKFRSKHILIIGEADCGKSTLLSVLKGASAAEKTTNSKGNKLVKSGYALDYYYLDIESEELDVTDEEVRKCSVWVLRGASGVHSLLQSEAYSSHMVPHTLFTLVLDFSQPWSLKQSLESGIQHIQSIISKLEVSPDVLSGMKTKLERRFQLFYENETDAKQKSANTSLDELLPLGDGILTENLGVPIMLICTKLDSLAELEKSYKYNDEHFDYIQQFLRLECLKYGASLVYTSSKDSRYVSGLYKLILNSLYEVLPKSGSLASVVEKDSIFVPIGWDNLLKIKALQENLIGEIKFDDVFEDVCKQPANFVNKKNPHQESNRTPLMADEEQIFLNRSQSALQKPVQAPASILAGSPGRLPAGGNRTPLAQSANASEQNLQQFFNSLLNSNKSRSSTSGSAASGMSSPSRNSSALATPDQRRMTAPPKSILQQPGTSAAAATPTPATNGTTDA